MLATVRHSGERLFGLIQDLLLVSGVERPSADAAGPVDVDELLDRVRTSVAPMLAGHSASLSVSARPSGSADQGAGCGPAAGPAHR